MITSTAFFCAGQRSPTGGPPDIVPPEIIETYPHVSSLNFHDRKFRLEFSEYVDRRSLEESIFISPSLGRLTYDWSGTEVEISFTDSLRSHTTYIMTIGTDVVDIRNRNRMEKAFQLPFSTGDHIDSASISGKIYDADPVGVMVFAYGLSDRDDDTIDPKRAKPDFLSQTGKDGIFVLTNLPLGIFRLIAVRDQYKNLLYDPQIDRYGISSSDIELTSDKQSIRGVQIRMSVEDTTAPFLSSARAVDQTHILLRFSEEVDMAGDKQSVRIVDTLTNSESAVIEFTFLGESSMEAEIVTAQQESTGTYRVALEGFRDIHGNEMRSPFNTGIFVGSTQPDTSKPRVTMVTYKDSNVRAAIDDTLRFTISESIQKSVFEGGFSITDSLGQEVKGEFLWGNSTTVSFPPFPSLLYGMKYTVKVILDSLIDFSGNRYLDSVWVQHFQTIDERSLGSIEGNVIDQNETARDKIFLIVNKVSSKESETHQLVIDTAGTFAFDRIPEGRYTLFAFRDTDKNRVYSYGKPFPFAWAERFVEYPETLKVRARWPLEGLLIQFK
ncbi:MAG: Ig-like domain-containing protein [Ignavibacteriae bacterium]|nr:Ig-like domain-containing protein [Ignavibacteriota bacterium]